jgi:uncharacterized membrane protein YphA (DoxX/SURF4 family)
VARATPWLGLGIRLLAAGIWIVAGAAKIADLQHFHAQVQGYKLLPGSLEAPFAYALPFVEVAVGLYLLVGLLVGQAAILSCLLMLAFIAAMGQAYARGLSLECGCFGSLARQQIGIGSMLRDAALGLPGLVMALRPSRFLSLDHALLGKADGFRPRSRASRKGQGSSRPEPARGLGR